MKHIVTASEVRLAALEVWKSEGVDLWYYAPNPKLHNATPDQYVRAGDGDKVLGLISALAEGVFL